MVFLLDGGLRLPSLLIFQNCSEIERENLKKKKSSEFSEFSEIEGVPDKCLDFTHLFYFEVSFLTGIGTFHKKRS